ncbi:MAG: hypothetical protein K9N49_02720, partial [Candidatus Marinimicrobia bacterium]|nr:hypothetical protein [Candidatus Neomarinimicrobiota bacterium]
PARELGGVTPVCILCVSDLPSTRLARRATLEVLRAKGITGVLLFRTILTELIERIEVSKSYEKSDVLQVLRILKNYGLLKDAQLELFGRRPRRRKNDPTRMPPAQPVKPAPPPANHHARHAP